MGKRLAVLDRLATGMLLIWIGMAGGFGLFHGVSTRQGGTLARWAIPMEAVCEMIEKALTRLDMAAFVAFGGALCLLWARATLTEKGVSPASPGAISPFRLWIAAAMAALLMCFASMAISTPRMVSERAAWKVAFKDMKKGEADRIKWDKAHSVSLQFLAFRVVLALGLALSVRRVTQLPKQSKT